MVVCGALRSIPDIFKETKRLDKVNIFAEDFEDIDEVTSIVFISMVLLLRFYLLIN